MLVNQPGRPNVLQSNASSNGHRRTASVAYMPRGVMAQASASAGICDITLVPGFKEKDVTIAQYAHVGLHFPDDTLRTYCEAWSDPDTAGNAPVVRLVREGVLKAMNAMYARINATLTGLVVWGANVNNSYSNAAKTITIPLAGTSQDLDAGVLDMLADIQDAEFCGMPSIVGTGLFRNYNNLKVRGALGMNQAGVNSAAAVDWQFFYDNYATTAWGSNVIGVFEPGSIHLLEADENVGSFAGQKGTAFYTQIVDPRMQCWGDLPFTFDLAVDYINCPTTLTNAYTGSTATFNRGWAVYIRKRFDLFQTPTDANDGADVSHGVNGALRFTVANA